MATDPDGKKLYTASADAFIRFWDVKSGKAIKAFEAHHSAIIAMNVSHRLMYTGRVHFKKLIKI